MFVSLKRAAAVSISSAPANYGSPDALIINPGTSYVTLEIGYTLALRIAQAIDAQERACGFEIEERHLDIEEGEICIWGDTLRPSRQNVSWEIGGFEARGSGYIQLMIECAREGDDALDGTLPPPVEPSIGQLMDCAAQIKRLLALGA